MDACSDSAWFISKIILRIIIATLMIFGATGLGIISGLQTHVLINRVDFSIITGIMGYFSGLAGRQLVLISLDNFLNVVVVRVLKRIGAGYR